MFACLSLTISAQDIVSLFLHVYDNDNDLELVTIGKKMLDIVKTMSGNEEISQSLQGIENIRVISSESSNKNQYHETAFNLLTKKDSGYEELLSISNENETVLIMIKGSKKTVKELVVLSSGTMDKQKFNLISLSGQINLKELIKRAKSFNIKGLEKLDSVKNIEKE